MTQNAEYVCVICGRAEDRTKDERGKFKVELRPYGPGGQPICFKCAFATPERADAAKRAYGAILDGATAMGSGIATLTDHGVEPGLPPNGRSGAQ